MLWTNNVKGLSLRLRCDQHLVCEGWCLGGDGEQGAEGGVTASPSVEAEDELVEVGLEMPGAQAVIGAERPGLEVGEHPVNPGLA